MALIGLHHEFIFIHVYKTGGTSIREILDGNEIGDGHAPAWVVRKRLYEEGMAEVWETAWKFAVVRHPYDWLVSLFHHLKGSTEHYFHYMAHGVDFPKFICNLTKEYHATLTSGFHFFDTQFSWLSSDEQIIVDEVFRFEQFPVVFRQLQERFGNHGPELHRNASRERKGTALDYFTPESLQTVNQLFETDFHRFGYNMTKPHMLNDSLT